MSSQKFVWALFLLLLSQGSWAGVLKLTEGSYANRTHLDMALGRANLNFIYEGCDKELRTENLQYRILGCAQEKINRRQEDGRDYQVSSLVGETEIYYKDSTTCEESERVRKPFHANFSLKKIYESFNEEKNCYPTHLVLKSQEQAEPWKIERSKAQVELCDIPYTRVKVPGFPTESHESLHFRANDKGFTIGNHTEFFYNYETQSWCRRPLDGSTGVGCQKASDIPSPLPLYRNRGQLDVQASLELLPDGKAIIRALDNKTFPNIEALSKANAAGQLTQTNPSKGRIEFQTKRKDNGLARSIVRTFKQDNPYAPHQRAVNFFARNVFGAAVTESWCDEEHCFNGIEKHPDVEERIYETLAPVQCKKPHAGINMANGGSNNVCRSCLGIMPGLCAIENGRDCDRDDVSGMRKNLWQDTENGLFEVMNTGEPKPHSKIEVGLYYNFKRMVTAPPKRGCHKGTSPAFDDVFNCLRKEDELADPVGATGTRSVDSLKPKAL